VDRTGGLGSHRRTQGRKGRMGPVFCPLGASTYGDKLSEPFFLQLYRKLNAYTRLSARLLLAPLPRGILSHLCLSAGIRMDALDDMWERTT
jgi:hypothetical protein